MASPFVLRRTTARTLLLDPDGRSLLIRSSDPVDRAKAPWWELPGGGIEGRERPEDAAARELEEETGITEVQMGPCVWTQRVRFTFAGMRFDQFEHVHVAWTPAAVDLAPRRLEALEAMAFEGHRWWSADDLAVAPDQVFPARIREVLHDVVAGRIPPTPIDITPPHEP
jgi:8-oxo-dGTP pyrophosphatase MutT (NUDIX family)